MSTQYHVRKVSPKRKESALHLQEQYLEYESALQTMFCDTSWQQSAGVKKKLRVLSYCLYYRCITKQQLLTTRITPMIESDSERVFLGRLVKDGLMTGEYVDLNGERACVYSLTGEGALWCSEKLRKLIKAGQLPLSEEALDAVYRRFTNTTPNGYSAHYLCVRDLNAFLLSRRGGAAYHYLTETYIRSDGHVLTLAEKITASHGKGAHSDVSIIADAMYEQDGLTDYGMFRIFVEQDMSTQKRNVISRKIHNYLTVLAPSCNCLAYRSVLFSLQSRQTDAVTYEKAEKGSLKSPTAYYNVLSCVPLTAYAMAGEEWEEVLAEDLSELMEGYLSENEVFMTRYKNTLSYLKDASSRGETVGELIDRIKEHTGESRAAAVSNKKERLALLYKKRRSLIRQICLDMGNLFSYFYEGFSVCTSPNLGHEHTFPYLYQDPCGKLPDPMTAFIRRYFKEEILAGYEPFSLTFPDECGFKNHYSYQNGLHLYIENISDDIGGYIRVKHYFETLSFSGPSGILLCLMEDEPDAVSDLPFLTKSAYIDAVRQQDPVPLKVMLLPYKNAALGMGVFSLSEDGSWQATY